jgi:PPOX class probable F420-dependent enzyme
MVDFATPVGQVIARRLKQEQIIWLTTVDAQGTPQPRPVWFHWDGGTVLILSQPEAAKIRHVRRSPRVALNFNTDAGGGQVGVLTGEARISSAPIEAGRWQAYVDKYAAGIKSLGMTPETMRGEYAAALLITPTALRGF